MPSFMVEVLPSGEHKYVANGLRFTSRAEAEEYRLGLLARWFGINAARVAPSDDAPNTDGNGRLAPEPMTQERWDKMTQERWDKMTPAQREAARDNSELSPQLIGLEGWRVEVVDDEGERYRFIVGESTGWRPIHLELKTRRSLGGVAARKHYAAVRKLEPVR